MSQLLQLMNTETGTNIVSIILGLGLAAIFRKACKDNSCILIKGPPSQDVQKYTYKINDQCFKYTPVVTQCGDETKNTIST